MKIDFHTHGKLAKKLPFSEQYTDWLFQEANKAGLDAIFLTEHFNTQGFFEIYKHISTHYHRIGDSFRYKNLKIFPGMEVDIKEGGHILVCGIMEDILILNKKLEPHKEKERFLSCRDLFQILRQYSVMIGAAHPFREGGNIPFLPIEDIKQFDFIDLNGKDMAENGVDNQIVIDGFSKEFQKPVLGGSDTHQSFQYGCIYNRFDNDCNTIQEIRKEIKEGNYTIEISECIKFQVKTAGLLKKALKTIHSLNGDYVSVLVEEEEK